MKVKQQHNDVIHAASLLRVPGYWSLGSMLVQSFLLDQHTPREWFSSSDSNEKPFSQHW